jgi:hypothetical protein
MLAEACGSSFHQEFRSKAGNGYPEGYQPVDFSLFPR